MAAGARLRNIFNRSFWIVAFLTALSGVACYWLRGPELFLESFKTDLELVGMITPRLGAALLIAASIQVLLPREKVARWLGDQAGLKGMLIATGAGMVTPGGPMTSFPVVNALHEAGTGRRALVAYLTSWSTQGFQRILMWELPMMGLEFATFRFLVSLPLPIVAGMISRFVPIDTERADTEAS
ncbi:MAG TPA: permease [Beijerinckiaceae bacterium]|jgi:uncharacterized membrane protein YraQ (UPF0718 family)